MTRRRRLLWIGGALVLAVALVVGHWLYWYAPRLRADAPGDDEAARLLHDEGFEHAAWIAHPHQTLPALGELSELDGRSLEALGRLAGVDLAGLEGLRKLPARSLAVAAASEGEWAGAAHVHPLAAGFLRLSGRLAGNPLLAGGTVDLGRGESAVVRWSFTEWSVRSARAPQPEASAGRAPVAGAGDDDALAWLRLGRSADPRLPSGLLALREGQERLELASPGSAATLRPRLDTGRALLDRAGALLLVRRAADAFRPDEALFVFAHPPGTPSSELPRSALLYRSSESVSAWQRSDLPGESLLELAERELARGRRGPWQAVATDAQALGAALAAAEILPDPVPRWALAVDLRPAAGELRRLADGLEGSPLLPLRSRRRWSDAATVLDAVGRRPGRIDGVVTADGEAYFRFARQTDLD